MQSHAKVLKLIPKNGQEDDTFFNYRQAKPSSSLEVRQ
jgi:hypothetical protein